MLKDLLDKFDYAQVENTKLFFITRQLKDGVKKSHRVPEKYDFVVHQADIDADLRNFLFELTKGKIDFHYQKDYEINPYDPLQETNTQILSYNLENKAFSFKEVVENKLLQDTDISKIEGLNELKNRELWAYCIGIEINEDEGQSKWLYGFRKTSSTKIAINETENFNITTADHLSAFFNTQSEQLEALKREAISIDKKLDCVFFEGNFYVIQKGNFETLTGLTEEYREIAEALAKEFEDTDLVEGIDQLKEEIEQDKPLNKKLARIQNDPDFKNLTKDRIKRMEKVAEKNGYNLKNKEDGSILLENKQDVDMFVKMLNDYFVESEQTGNQYGSFSKKKIKPQN